VDAFPAGYGRVVSGELNYLMRRMMQQGSEGVAATPDNWPVANLSGDSVEAEVLFTPAAQSPKGQMPTDQADLYRKRMWYLVKSMDDLTADVWDALVAQWVAEARTPDAKVWVSVDQILQYRGLASHLTGATRRGGYSTAQRAAITESLLRIIAMRVQVFSMVTMEEQETGEGLRQVQPMRRQVGGPALEVSMDLSQVDFLDRLEIKALKIRPGEMFARYYMTTGRPVAILSQRALTYRQGREDVEKRLTRFFAYAWDRHGAGDVDRQRYTVTQLLEAVHQQPNHLRPDDIKMRLERALRRLAEDHVIAGWEYVSWDEAARPARRWLPLWIATEIEVQAPPEVKQFYALALPAEAAQIALATGLPPQIADGKLTGDSVETLRRHFGLNQEEFAARLGVTRSLIAQIETGRRPVSARLADAIKRWLAGTPS
jgi:DNA-binding XRE family transcriptional regulator